jgi:hypothetical protein
MIIPTAIFNSFSDEMRKIAGDAGTRATMAAKLGLGQKYLPGGELPSNAPGETNFEPKLAEKSFKEKMVNLYHRAKGPVGAAIHGAVPAIFLGQMLTGARLGRDSAITRLGYRGFGGLGAGVALADYYSKDKNRHPKREERKAILPDPTLEPEKVAGVISSFTPARQLSANVQTGSFKNIVHAGSQLRPPKVGQKFNFPSEPQ